MSEETTVTEKTPTTTTAAPEAKPEPTLDDVYREAGSPPIEGAQPQAAPAAAPQAAPAAPAAPQIQAPPDPYDTEAHKAYLARLAQTGAATQAGLLQVAGYLSTIQQREQKAALEADIGKAVTTVNEVVKHPNPKVVEAMLDAKARENPQFKALWENRGKNPAAWGNALKVVAREFSKDFEFKVDPKLAASQEALRLSRQSMATTAPESESTPLEEALAKAQGSDFESLWEQARSG